MAALLIFNGKLIVIIVLSVLRCVPEGTAMCGANTAYRRTETMKDAFYQQLLQSYQSSNRNRRQLYLAKICREHEIRKILINQSID